MGIAYNPRIVTDGLVLALDAGNTKSYPGSGTTWSDLSGNSNNGTLVNGVGFDDGTLTFDGVNDYFTTTLSIGDSNTSFSWGGLVKVNSSTSANFFILSNYTQSPTTPFYAIAFNSSGDNTFIYIRDSGNNLELLGTTVNLDLGKWYYLIAVRDHSLNQVKLYLNGELKSTNTFPGSYNVNSSSNKFGGVSHSGKYINCNISNVQVYNRALSAEEVQQNFNATRSRFGI